MQITVKEERDILKGRHPVPVPFLHFKFFKRVDAYSSGVGKIWLASLAKTSGTG